MKRIGYYKSCSLEASSKDYARSLEAGFARVGTELVPIRDWSCCGASSAHATSELLGLALPARDLALAEQTSSPVEGTERGERDVLTVCSACYTNFRRTSEAVASDPALLKTVNQALEVEGLVYRGAVTARHLMDVLANDFDLEEIKAELRRELTEPVMVQQLPAGIGQSEPTPHEQAMAQIQTGEKQ